MSSASDDAIRNAQMNTALMQQSPSVLYRPKLSADGDKWCALYGDNLVSGVAGFGDTPAAAMFAFDEAWISERTPAARRNATVNT